jgi:hypothetical protein
MMLMLYTTTTIQSGISFVLLDVDSSESDDNDHDDDDDDDDHFFR